MNEKCKKYDDMSDVFEYGNISDYIISILAFTGNRKYINIIKSIGEKYGDLNISGAIGELESRCNISLDDPKPS